MNCTRCGKWAGAYARGARQPVDDLCHCPPVKREWKGLTNEERQECLKQGVDYGWLGVANAVEAKLKEKNA